jgi:hypothetical protein
MLQSTLFGDSANLYNLQTGPRSGMLLLQRSEVILYGSWFIKSCVALKQLMVTRSWLVLTWDQLSFEQVWLCFLLFFLFSLGLGFFFFMLLIGFCYAVRYEISMTFIIGSDLSSVQITLNHKHEEFSVLLKILPFEQVSSSQQVLNLDSIHIRCASHRLRRFSHDSESAAFPC